MPLHLPPSLAAEPEPGGIEAYDHEMAHVERCLAPVLNNTVRGKTFLAADEVRHREKVTREIKERFAESTCAQCGRSDLGLVVDVLWYANDGGNATDGVLHPTVEVIGRVDTKHAFDRDRQVHEVTQGTYGFGESGVIKSDLSKVRGHGADCGDNCGH